MIDMGLDILTERGQVAARHQQEAVEIVVAHRPGTSFVNTALDDSAAIDGFFTQDGVVRAACEIKCRYDMDLARFMAERKGEWLVTHQKVLDLAKVCELLRIPGYMMLYLVADRLVLVKKVVDHTGQVTGVARVEATRTQKTINGGEAFRQNAFINMQDAMRFKAI